MHFWPVAERGFAKASVNNKGPASLLGQFFLPTYDCRPLLNVVVQSELVRMRTQTDRVHFLLALVLDVGADQLFGEYITLEHEGMVFLQTVERFVECARHGWDLRQLLRPEIVDVLIERLAWINLVLDAVQAGHHHGGERHVRVAARIGWTELDTLCFGRRRVHWDAARRGAIPARVREVDGRFKARHQTHIAVGGRSDDGRV